MNFDRFDKSSPLGVSAFVKGVGRQNAAGDGRVDVFGFINNKTFSVKHSFLLIFINNNRAHDFLVRIRNDCNQEINQNKK